MTDSASRRLAELYDLREALETHAVASADRLDPEECQRMRESTTDLRNVMTLARQHGWTRQYADRWLLADATFHLSLLRATGNQSMLRLMEEWNVIPGIFGWRSEYVAGTDHDRIQKEHEEMLTAVSRNDVCHARDVVVRHLRRGLETALCSVREIEHP